MSDPSTTQTAPATFKESNSDAMHGGYCGSLGYWIYACFQAKHIIAPDLTFIIMSLAVLVAPAKMVGRIIMFKLSQADKGDTQP